MILICFLDEERGFSSDILYSSPGAVTLLSFQKTTQQKLSPVDNDNLSYLD